jgi:hypothetical protein
MPNRIISDVTYQSKKIRTVQPPEFRVEYAWIMPVVEDNGCFEYDPETIWATAYSLPRPGWTPEKVKAVLDEFIRVGLLMKYEVANHTYCYLVGSDKPGHLPSKARQYSTVPPPPGKAGDGAASSAVGRGTPTDDALGIGNGYGFGEGNGTDPSQPQNLHTPTGGDTSIPQNPIPTTQNPEPSKSAPPSADDLPEAPEGFRHDAPVGLAWEFGEWLKMTNPRRKKLGHKEVPLQRPSHWKITWAGDFRRLFDAGYTTAEIRTMMKFVFNSDRWLPYIVRPAGFVKCHDQIAGDLRISAREVAPELTAGEKATARGKRQQQRDKEDYSKHVEGVLDENDAHRCPGGCGTILRNDSTHCQECLKAQLEEAL